MLVDHIELVDPTDVTPFLTWLENHPTATIERVIPTGFHFYIWYTE